MHDPPVQVVQIDVRIPVDRHQRRRLDGVPAQQAGDQGEEQPVVQFVGQRGSLAPPSPAEKVNRVNGLPALSRTSSEMSAAMERPMRSRRAA